VTTDFGPIDPSYALTVDSTGKMVQLTFSPVPEPGTILGIAAAGMGLAGWVRRRRNAKA
jgi:hypothetical protein